MLNKLKRATLPRTEISRRGFLTVVGLSGAGFLIGCSRDGADAPATSAAGDS